MTEQQQHVQRLATFCSAVAHALFRGGVGVEQIGTIFRLGLSAECVQCGIRISGEELFVLAQPAFDAAEHPKIRRLRLGDCARLGCDSCYYRVRFWPVGSLDWSALLSEVEAHRDEPVVEIPTRLSILASRFLSFAPSAKACVALGLLVVVFTAGKRTSAVGFHSCGNRSTLEWMLRPKFKGNKPKGFG